MNRRYFIIAVCAIFATVTVSANVILAQVNDPVNEEPVSTESDAMDETAQMDSDTAVQEDTSDASVESVESEEESSDVDVEVDFSDVNEDHLNYGAIQYVAEQGIVEGYPDGTYKPDQPINRAEFTKILVGSAYDYDPAQDPAGYDIYSTAGLTFTDIEDQAWYVPFLRTAVNENVIEGYPDGTFKPDQNVNFAEAAKIIVESFGYDYDDDADVWYKGYVDVLADRRAIPVSITSFDEEITRGEMAEMIYRLKTIDVTKDTTSYEKILKSSDEVEVGDADTEDVEDGDLQQEEQKVSLYFGRASENTAADSYPVYVMDCFEMGCTEIPFSDDEWEFNTDDRFAFDIDRNDIYYSKDDDGSRHIYRYNIETGDSEAVVLDSYDMSYRPYIHGDTMAVAVSKGGVKNVIKYDLATAEISDFQAFNEYAECDWPSVGGDEKLFATCTDSLKSEYSVVDEDGNVYYTAAKHLESLVVSDEGIAYFVEEGFVKVLDLATKFVRGTDVIPPFHITYTLTISPDNNYLAGFGEVSGEWVVGIYDRRTGILTMPLQLEEQPGIPSFGPYIESIDRSQE